MHAEIGDELVVRGTRMGQHDRTGLIREVRGPEGHPPYVVEWDDQPGEAVVWPGSDAYVKHLGEQPPSAH
jgi:hypothetical protein